MVKMEDLHEIRLNSDVNIKLLTAILEKQGEIYDLLKGLLTLGSLFSTDTEIDPNTIIEPDKTVIASIKNPLAKDLGE